jgi:predicted HAD superfamily Cof-like phosphohydrolase
MMTSNLWLDVETFSRACDVRMRLVPGWVPDDELQLALSLVAEELSELDSALEVRDIVETADAVADSLYVLAGLALRLGVARRFVTDFLKAPIHGITIGFTALTGEDIRSVREDLESAHACILDAAHDRNLIRIDNAIHDAMYGVAGVGYMLGLPLQAVWDEVQRSNLAKLVGGIAIRRPDGKVMKPNGWTPPDIAGVLGVHSWSEAA